MTCIASCEDCGACTAAYVRFCAACLASRMRTAEAVIYAQRAMLAKGASCEESEARREVALRVDARHGDDGNGGHG